MKNDGPDMLVTKFKELKADERHAMLARQTKAMPGPSVVRVFNKDTKKDVTPALLKLNMVKLERCRTQEQFDQFYLSVLNKVDAAILAGKRKNRHVPVDRVVMKSLRRCDVKLPAKSIKGIDSKAKFCAFQDELTKAAKRAQAVRVVFDDVWSSN